MSPADKLNNMLRLTAWLRLKGVSPLCALRLALWSVERKRPQGECHCQKRDIRGVRVTCDELARGSCQK